MIVEHKISNLSRHGKLRKPKWYLKHQITFPKNQWRCPLFFGEETKLIDFHVRKYLFVWGSTISLSCEEILDVATKTPKNGVGFHARIHYEMCEETQHIVWTFAFLHEKVQFCMKIQIRKLEKIKVKRYKNNLLHIKEYQIQKVRLRHLNTKTTRWKLHPTI